MRLPLALLMALLVLSLPLPAMAQVDDGLATVRLDGRALFRLGGTEELEARLGRIHAAIVTFTADITEAMDRLSAAL